MNRNLYLTAIIFCSGMVVLDCFWLINNLIHGIEFYEFVTYPNLVVIHGIIILICEIIFLKYFHTKQYKVAFLISLLSFITFVTLYTLEYNFFVLGVDNEGIFHWVVIIHLIAVIMFSMSMVFSKASERPLLKKSGYAGLFVGLTVLFSHVLVTNISTGEIHTIFININLWVGRLGTLIGILYIMNFYQELATSTKA